MFKQRTPPLWLCVALVCAFRLPVYAACPSAATPLESSISDLLRPSQPDELARRLEKELPPVAQDVSDAFHQETAQAQPSLSCWIDALYADPRFSDRLPPRPPSPREPKPVSSKIEADTAKQEQLQTRIDQVDSLKESAGGTSSAEDLQKNSEFAGKMFDGSSGKASAPGKTGARKQGNRPPLTFSRHNAMSPDNSTPVPIPQKLEALLDDYNESDRRTIITAVNAASDAIKKRYQENPRILADTTRGWSISGRLNNLIEGVEFSYQLAKLYLRLSSQVEEPRRTCIASRDVILPSIAPAVAKNPDLRIGDVGLGLETKAWPEHHALLIRRADQDFHEGIVIDPWEKQSWNPADMVKSYKSWKRSFPIERLGGERYDEVRNAAH